MIGRDTHTHAHTHTQGQADVACLESALGACMRHKPPDEPQLGMFLACFHGPVTISQLSTVNTHSMSAHDTAAASAYAWAAVSVGREHLLYARIHTGHTLSFVEASHVTP